MTDFLQHIDAMIGLAQDLPDTEHIAATKREQLVLEARALDLAEMRALKPLKRYKVDVLASRKCSRSWKLWKMFETCFTVKTNYDDEGNPSLVSYSLPRLEIA